MKKIYLTLLAVITYSLSWGQGENCSAAVTLVNGSCVAGTPGLSQNIVGCVGNADDDSWYKFVATGTSHSLTVTGSGGYDAVLQFFSGTCSALISGACVDNTLANGAESTVISGLTPGNTYYVRVYHYYAGSSGSFTMCLNNPPAAPANDNCVNAINLTVNAGCVNTAGTSYGATTQTLYPACAGNPNDDVWYSFTATNYTQTIQVAGSAAMDPVVELFSGNCGSFTSMSCTDNTFSGGIETVTAGGLSPGVTYFFRVYDYYSSVGSTFSVCVSGNSIIAGSQPNDEPCNAIQLPAVTADCNNLTFSNVGATATSVPGTPPATCENYDNSSNTYLANTSGGFSASSADVWFKITVPASGNVFVTPLPNQGAGWIQDGVMALYRGTCSALTSYTCSDDYNYPAGYNDLQPFIRANGLTPGETVYLRYWGYGSAQGNFGFCVQSPTNGECSSALYICDINGYSANTSYAYARDANDHPCNMRGNGEGPGPTYSYSVNANPAGPFGAGGAWGTGSAINDVYIDNPSWVRFTAASTTVSLKVTVYDCWGVGTNTVTSTPGTPKGIQMQIFSTSSACCGFTPVSDYKENAAGSFSGGVSTFTVNANSLTVGNDYYIMIDGWGGDICNYSIQGLTGVAFPAITAAPGSVCPGQSSILTAPSGATGYTWEPTGQTTQTISVSPGTTMTYTCYVGGVCGYKQTLTKTINMLSVPSVSINSNNPITTCGTQTITLTGGGANTYSWSTGSTANSFTVAPSGNQSYSVIGTAVNGCTNTAVSNVTVNTVPTLTPGAVGSNTICRGNSASLTVGGANTYTWSPAATLSSSTGTAVTATPTTGTNYTIIGTAVNGCTNSATYSVTVNSLPTVGSTTTGSAICSGNSTTLNGTGATTYTWTGGVSNGVAFTPTATATYTVTGTNAATGCTNTAVRTITVSPTPTITISTSNSVICMGNSTSLTGNGATTYTWSNGIANGAAFSPTTTASYTVTGTTGSCTNTAVRTITVNPLPAVSSTASNSVICNGGSTTLNGTNATTYTWTGGITNGVAFSPTTTTTYTVTGTDANGCANTAVRTITVNAIPASTASTNGTITCVTNTVNLNSSLAGASYTWTAPGGSSIGGGTANNQNAIGQGAGTYTLQVKSAAGCTYSTTLATNINTLAPTASAGNGTLTCAVTSTVLTGGPTTGVTYSWSGPGIVGSNTIANITASVSGTYSLVTTSTVNGCPSTAAAVGTLTSNLTTPTVTAGPNQTITCAAPTVTLSGSATAGSNYSWNNGALTGTTTVSGSGTYTLTAINPSTGCSSTSTVQVLPSAGTPTANVSAASNSITCANTSATISITTGSSPISILWTGPGITGATNTASTTVSQGNVTYTVTLTNTSSMCSQSYNVYVPLNTTPVVAGATISAGPSSITCSTSSLTLSSSPTGPNYAYSWTGPGIVSGGNTANPVVDLGGNYSVTITNTVNGCSGATGTTTVTVPSNTATPTLSLSATSVTTTCGNTGITVTASSNSNPNTTYTWTAPATGTISNTSVNNPSIGGSGVFTVAITNTVSGCVSAAETVTVTPDQNIPTFNLSANTATINCAVSNPSVSLTSTVSGVTYSWSPVPASGITTASPTFTAAGNYTCLITNPANSCSTNGAVVTVTQDMVAPTATAAATSSITCSTNSLSITSVVTPSNNVTYTWTGPTVLSGASSLTPVIGAGGDYVITMTNTVNSCTNTYTVNVPDNTVSPAINVAANAYTTTCSSPGVTLSATSSSDPTTTYSWTAPATGTISNSAISNPVVGGSGVFTVAVTNTVNGCVSTVETVTITPDQNTPTFSLQATTATINCSVPSPSVSLTSTVSGVTYSWSPVPASGATTASPTFTASGNYTCTITNPANNCSTNAAQVSVNTDTTSPTVSITPNVSVTCNSTTAVLGSAATPSPVTYTWSGAGITGAANDFSVTATAGSYTLIVTNPVNGCSIAATAVIGTDTVKPTLILAATSTVISCSTSSSTLTANPSSGTPTWTIPGGSSATNPVIATVPGDYVATVIDNNNGCVSSQTISIAGNSIPPDANAGAATVMPCSSPSVTLMGSSTSTDVVTYSWAGPTPGSISSASNIANPTVTSTGVYTLTVTNSSTGCSQTATVSVTQNNVTANFTADPTSGEVPLTVTFTNTSVGANSYNWNFGNGNTSNIQNPGTLFTKAGTYTVMLIASNGGCSDTAVKTIVVEDGFSIEIPNVFTPNGDGVNEAFHIKTSGVKSAQGYIYNRWGQILYSWDVLNISWDGKASNGENCPDGTYYYLIKVIDKKDKEHLAPGFVLIAR